MTPQEHIHLKFSHIFQVLGSESFLNMDALGGEIPFWIAPYDIAMHNLAETEIHNLVIRLQNEGRSPLLIDLFELACDLIEQQVGIEEMIELEKEMNKADFKDALQSVLNIHERFIPAIVEQVTTRQPQMLLIKGVGAVYPFIRSHIILNNLQSAVKNIPTVMFFCGAYSGQSLNLFGLLKDDNYYRAFNIDTYKLKR